MFNNSRILIILIIISLGLASYVLFSLNKIDVQDEVNINLKIADSKVNMKDIEENYEQNLKNLIEEIRSCVDINKDSQGELNFNLEKIKNKISGLKSPSNEYEKVHLDLILALNNLEKYFELGDENEKNKSLALLEEANLEYLKITKEKENGI